MLNNLIITVDNEDFELINNGVFDIDRMLDLPIGELDQVLYLIEQYGFDGIEEIDIEEILFHLCRKILQQKQYIKELKDKTN